MLPGPQNFNYSPISQILTWDAVTGAEEYSIEYSQDPENDFVNLYMGANNYCPFQVPSGTYYLSGKTKSEGGWGKPGTTEMIVV